jgi:hypothetical protein
MVHAVQPRCAGGAIGACNDGFVTKISPQGKIVYSTFLGGKSEDLPAAIALDSYDDVYVAGSTKSPDFPTVKAVQPQIGGGGPAYDGFVSKLSANGRRLLYSTFLGGYQEDRVSAITVDKLGEAYITGGTESPHFRTSAGAVQPRFVGGDCYFFRCSDAFVVKLGTAGRFLAGTFLGSPSDDRGNAITLDHLGNVYVAGYTDNAQFPSTKLVIPSSKPLCGSESVVGTCAAAFVIEMSPRLKRLVYSRLLSGDGADSARSIAVNWPGNAVVGGYTESTNFPVVQPSQAASGGGPCVEVKGAEVPCDGFLAVIGPQNKSLRFSTYLGGNGSDEVAGLVLDGHGSAFLAGTTSSTNLVAGSRGPFPKVFLARVQELYR